MADDYAIVIATNDGQDAGRISVPDKKHIIVYENDTVYITPQETPYWFKVDTSIERCGTFKITASEALSENNENKEQETGGTTVRIVPGFSVIAYQKVGWKMILIGKSETSLNNCVLLDLQYDQIFYIQHNWNSKLKEGVYNNTITCYYDKTTMVEAAIWSIETPIKCFHWFESDPGEPAAPMYRHMIYLDKGQVSNFLYVFFVVYAYSINKAPDFIISLSDVLSNFVSAGLAEIAGGGFFTGIAISLLLTGAINAKKMKIKNPNGDIFEQINNFMGVHVTEQVRETTTGALFYYSDSGLKISIKDYTIKYPNDIFSSVVDASLIEAWDKNTGDSATVEGPKYYRGRFKKDSEVLGKNIGFTADSIINIFGEE